MNWRTRLSPATFALLLTTAAAASADDIRVMTSGGFAAAYLELAPAFEQATGHRPVTDTTSIGTGASGIAARLARGEAIDVVIASRQDIDRLIASGQIRAGSRVDLARSSIGMAVRRGAPKPDISTVDALRRTLLEATSIAYSASVSGVYLSTELFQQLGIADRVLPKSRMIEGERVGAVVARGDAEIGFQQISELLPVPGIDFVGPLPQAVQRVTVFSAGIGANARNPDLAKRLIDFMASPAAVPAIVKSALEAIGACAGCDPFDEPNRSDYAGIARRDASGPDAPCKEKRRVRKGRKEIPVLDFANFATFALNGQWYAATAVSSRSANSFRTNLILTAPPSRFCENEAR